MKTAFIICGALGRETLEMIQRHGWQAEVKAVPALNHVLVDRIPPDVEKRILELRNEFERLIVLFGDCGTGGKLDGLLAHHGVERVAGPHCYEMYGGEDFQKWMAEEPGTFFLTDYLVRGFKGTIMRGMGLDRHPELKEIYFKHYKRALYLAQNPTPQLLAQAQEAADYLGLPLQVRETGLGALEERLAALMAQPAPTVPLNKVAAPMRQGEQLPAIAKLIGKPAKRRTKRRPA